MPGNRFRRGLQYDSADQCPDVDAPPFHVEAKRGKKPNPRAAVAQAVADAAPGRIPVAVLRDDRAEPFVVLLLEDFLELVREWWEGRGR